MAVITGSVGRSGRNLRLDVITVQRLINNNIFALIPLARLVEDGACGARTIGAIEEFQRRVVRVLNPDGRVDPGGNTLRRLNGENAQTSTLGLPAFRSLWAAYPKTQLPCGDGYENQCAIRTSIALIGAGFPLAGYTEPRCTHGHARGAESLAQYLARRGRPEIFPAASARGRVLNRTGIVFFRNIAGFRGGIGDHMDLWNGSLAATDEYFAECQEVWFWPVP